MGSTTKKSTKRARGRKTSRSPRTRILTENGTHGRHLTILPQRPAMPQKVSDSTLIKQLLEPRERDAR